VLLLPKFTKKIGMGDSGDYKKDVIIIIIIIIII
jgi:hypothetical protein